MYNCQLFTFYTWFIHVCIMHVWMCSLVRSEIDFQPLLLPLSKFLKTVTTQLNQSLHISATITGVECQDPSVSTPRGWSYKHVPPRWIFLGCWGSKLRSLSLDSKYFTETPNSDPIITLVSTAQHSSIYLVLAAALHNGTSIS